jgi:hypothetical protein
VNFLPIFAQRGSQLWNVPNAEHLCLKGCSPSYDAYPGSRASLPVNPLAERRAADNKVPAVSRKTRFLRSKRRGEERAGEGAPRRNYTRGACQQAGQDCAGFDFGSSGSCACSAHQTAVQSSVNRLPGESRSIEVLRSSVRAVKVKLGLIQSTAAGNVWNRPLHEYSISYPAGQPYSFEAGVPSQVMVYWRHPSSERTFTLP